MKLFYITTDLQYNLLIEEIKVVNETKTQYILERNPYRTMLFKLELNMNVNYGGYSVFCIDIDEGVKVFKNAIKEQHDILEASLNGKKKLLNQIEKHQY